MTAVSAPTEAGASAVATNLDDLLARQGADFVRCAYLTLMGREADAEGLRYYTERMGQGYSRMSVVAQLCKSREAGPRGKALPGLAAALQRYRRSHWPVIGAFFRQRAGEEGDSTAERAVRVAQAHQTRVNAQMLAQLRQLEERIGQTDASIQALREYTDGRLAQLQGLVPEILRLINDGVRRQGASQRDARQRVDEAREWIDDLRLWLYEDRERLDDLENLLGALQRDLRDGAPPPAPLGAAELKALRAMSPLARLAHGRLRRATGTGAD